MTEYMQGRVGVSLSVERADTILSVYSPFSVLLKVLFRGLCVLFFFKEKSQIISTKSQINFNYSIIKREVKVFEC
jgi:hypothetical protein